jgi:nicotinamidase-related amidase
VAGLVTNGCVESTVRSAAELDYGVYLAEDSTTTFSPELHAYSVLSMGSRDAAVKSTDEVIALLEALPAPKLEESLT